jgi:hypothetical protein
MRQLLENLMPASGHQDHTTSPSASNAFVYRAKASIASRPAFVTIASRPFVGRDSELICLIWVFGKSEIFFRMRLDNEKTAGELICPSGKSRCAQDGWSGPVRPSSKSKGGMRNPPYGRCPRFPDSDKIPLGSEMTRRAMRRHCCTKRIAHSTKNGSDICPSRLIAVREIGTGPVASVRQRVGS